MNTSYSQLKVMVQISRDDFFLLHRHDKSENQEDEDEEGGEILSLKCVSNMETSCIRASNGRYMLSAIEPFA